MRGPPPRREEGEQLPAVEGVIVDAGEMRAGDRVVYPNQGVCRVTGIEVKEIAGHRLEMVRMEREEDGAAVLVPRAKVPSIGLRKVASGDQMEGVFHYLAAQYDDPELNWKIRHRDNADRLIAGGVLGVAEVVKGLHALSRIRPLPAKEREQYDNARHLLVHEVAVSLGVPPALAEDYVDYALMPPVGTVFKLKPPPKPVVLPSRPSRRVVRTDDEDLELDDLGLDLAVPGGEAPEGLVDEALPALASADDVLGDVALPDDSEGEAESEGAESAEGEEGEDDGQEDEGEDEEVAPAARGKKGAAAKVAPAGKAKAAPAKKAAPATKQAEPAKPARKAAPAKASPAKAAPAAPKKRAEPEAPKKAAKPAQPPAHEKPHEAKAHPKHESGKHEPVRHEPAKKAKAASSGTKEKKR